MMTVSQLLWWVIALFVAFCVIVGLIVRIVPNSVACTLRSRTEPFSPILSLLFGTSVTLAAAVGTLTVASFASRTSDEQNERNLYLRLSDRKSEIHRIYGGVSAGISRLFRAGHGILVYYQRHRPLQDDELPPEIALQVDIFVDALMELDVALQEVQFDLHAYRLLAPDYDRHAMEVMSGDATGSASWLAQYPSFDLMELRQAIHGSRISLTLSAGEAIENAYCTVLLNGEQEGLAEDRLGALQWIAFTGYLIYVTDSRSDDGKEGFISSIGLALLHDLYFALPDEFEIEQHLKEIPGSDDSGVDLEVDHDIMLGPAYADAIGSLIERPDLMLMPLPRESDCFREQVEEGY